MTGIVLTQVSTPIIGQAAWLLGKLMEGVYYVLDGVFGIQNIGVCIILLTIIVYSLMIPLTIRQQKFSKMTAVMNPELQKIQKKYKGKNDQVSMQKMQEETQMVYDKYGTSPTGGCLGMVIQLPILWAVYYVIRSVPAYVGQVRDVYMPLINQIQNTDGWQAIMEGIGEARPVLMDPSTYDYSQTNTLIDVLYKFTDSTWQTLSDSFPQLQSTINSTMDQVHHINNFLGLNIAESPWDLIRSGFATGAIGIAIVALLIPILSGLTQYLSIKLMPNSGNTNNDNSQMASTMKAMNLTMPLFSVFLCFTMPSGLGIYWVMSAVVRTVQQIAINRHLGKMSMDELIEQNMEKAAKKKEKREKKQKKVDAQNLNEMARMNVRNIKEPVSAEKEKQIEEKLEAARKKGENAKEGSLTAKANLVRKFNESNK